MEDFCNRIHKLMLKNFKYALVWGTSVKHRPQRVGKEHQARARRRLRKQPDAWGLARLLTRRVRARPGAAGSWRTRTWCRL